MTYGGTSNQMFVTNGGAGIVVSNIKYQFQTGTFWNDSGAMLGSSSHLWGQIYSTNSAISQSDANRKHDIEPLPEKYLILFDNLVPYRYKLDNGTSNRFHTGFTAQNAKAAMDVADVDALEFGGWIADIDEETGEDVYFLRYEEFIAILVAKIKQLEQRIEEVTA